MKLYITILAFVISWASFAQGPKREKIKAFKIAFLTERLDLTSAEAQKFWPIYNGYNDKMEKMHSEERTLMFTMRQGFDTMEDGEAKNHISTILSNEQKRIDHKKQLIADLDGVISSKKMLILFKTEEDFKRRLLKQLQERRGKRD